MHNDGVPSLDHPAGSGRARNYLWVSGYFPLCGLCLLVLGVVWHIFWMLTKPHRALCKMLTSVLLRNCFLSVQFFKTLWTNCGILTFQESGLWSGKFRNCRRHTFYLQLLLFRAYQTYSTAYLSYLEFLWNSPAEISRNSIGLGQRKKYKRKEETEQLVQQRRCDQKYHFWRTKRRVT